MKHRRLIKMPASPSQISLREGMPVLRQRRRKAKRSMLGACSIRCHGISLREHAPALRTSGVSRRPDDCARRGNGNYECSYALY